MYIVIFCSLIALLLTYLESTNQVKDGMKWGFVIVTILGMIHYDYGNDYMSYYEVYKQVTSYTFDLHGILAGEYYREPGWVLLCWFFKYLGGFFMMVAILNIVQNMLVYRTIKNYVEKKWWSLSVFIYLFSTSFYLLNFSMMRQGFVVCVFLGLWSLIKAKKWYLAAPILWLCSFVHTSALILIPFAFAGFVPIGKGKVWASLYIIVFLALWFSGSVLNDIFMSFMTIEEFQDYADTYSNDNNSMKIGLGFAMNLIPFILGMMYLRDTESGHSFSDKLVVSIGLIGFVITPFSSILPMIGRLGMYFGSYQMIAMPLIYKNLKRKDIQWALLFLFVFMRAYDYLIFFKSPVWIDKFTTFKTIFHQIL